MGASEWLQIINGVGELNRAFNGSPAPRLAIMAAGHVAKRIMAKGVTLTKSARQKLLAKRRKKSDLYVSGINVLENGVRVLSRRQIPAKLVCRAL